MPAMLAAIPFPDITPEIFTIRLGEFSFALRWYALAYILGILIGWRILGRLARRDALWPGGKAPYSATDAEDFLTWAILGVILGGRLGFVLFYQPAHYLANPAEIPMVWQGGMSFHGGFLGVIAATILFSRRRGIRLSGLSDALAVSIAPGLLLGRIANFINAELWGRPTDLPWGVIFPGEMAQDCGQIAGACARHPSQLYEAGLEGLLLGLLVWLAALRWGWLKRSWRLTGLFLLVYGSARFLVEFVRVADAQFITPDNPLGHALGFGGGYGLSMGQVLSLPMIAVGLVLVVRARRPAPA
jgi:phosphatidylglycerol:prolipoprotein diacylglycerol transferase